MAVGLTIQISPDLRREGLAREIVHAVQNARKAAGLQVEDRIELALDGDATLVQAARAHRDHIAGETLAVDLLISEDPAAGAAAMDHSEQATIDGLALGIALRRAASPTPTLR